jgi:hypothetical protein
MKFGSGCKTQFYFVYFTILTCDSTLFLTNYSKTDKTRWKSAGEPGTRHDQIQSVRHVLTTTKLRHVFHIARLRQVSLTSKICHVFPTAKLCHMFHIARLRQVFLTSKICHLFSTAKLCHVFPTVKLCHVFPTAKLCHVSPTAKLCHVFPIAKLCHVFPTAKLKWRVCRQLSSSTESSPASANNSIFSASKEMILLSILCHNYRVKNSTNVFCHKQHESKCVFRLPPRS